MEWTENGNTEIAEASVWSENRGQEADETGFVAKADVDRENPQVPTDVTGIPALVHIIRMMYALYLQISMTKER